MFKWVIISFTLLGYGLLANSNSQTPFMETSGSQGSSEQISVPSWTPVLKEGRYRPYGTLAKEERNLMLLKKQGRIPFEKEIEEYRALEGKPFQKAHKKNLFYPSKWQLKAELFLHSIPTKWLLIIGYLLALFWRKLILIPFTLHTTVLLLHCYILKRPPVSNMAETIFYVPWIAALTSLCFKKEKEGATICALLLFFLPQKMHFENVQAVLDSQYWLTIHVLMVVGSYGILFFAGILGHLYFFKKNMKLERILIRALYIGTGLLIGGTLLGGVWAAQSWGRFWDWDPKEAWAFISSGIYLCWIHAYQFKKISGWGLAIGAIVGLMSVTFTWYGVNYILSSGLHSYGFGSGGAWPYYLYLGAEIIFLTLIGSKKHLQKLED